MAPFNSNIFLISVLKDFTPGVQELIGLKSFQTDLM